MTAGARTLTDVLNEHQSDEEMGSMWCNGCDRIPIPHHEHLAEQVTAWLGEQLGSAEMREAVESWLHVLENSLPDPSVQQYATEALAAVTERLGVQP